MKDITEKAMLVKLKVRGSGFGTTKKDKEVSEDVAAKYGAEKDAGAYTKRLIAKRFTQRLSSIGGDAKKAHNRLTLPWDDDGERILPMDVYFDYMQETRQYQAVYKNAVIELRDQWDDAMDEARRRLGSMFNEKDYRRSKQELFCLHPDTGEFLHFRLELRTRNIPVGNDFRVALNRDESERVRAEINRQYQDTIASAVEDLWGRLEAPIKTLSQRIESYDNEDGKSFQAAWVNNIKAVIEIIPRLNVTGDKRIDDLCRNAEKLLCAWNADQLKASKATRDFVKKNADDILAQMASYTGMSFQEAA